jgi:pyrophosphatase PpaX
VTGGRPRLVPAVRSNAMRFPVVLFDLDGTLIDSGAIILASFQHAARTVLNREVPAREILARVGGTNLREQMRAIDPDRVDDLVSVYREHNEPLAETLEAFEGVLDVVERLHDEGRRLGVVTAKRRASLDLALARVPLEPYLDVIVASEDTDRHKPDPDPLLEALRRLEATVAEAVYVGDSPFDVQAAKSAGMYMVGVTWGRIHGPEALEGADVVVETAEELLDVV